MSISIVCAHMRADSRTRHERLFFFFMLLHHWFCFHTNVEDNSHLVFVIIFCFSFFPSLLLFFCVPGRGGQCQRQACAGCLAVVAAAAAAVSVTAPLLALGPCPSHNAVIHAEGGPQGPRGGRPLLQGWPWGCLLRSARDWSRQLWCSLLCESVFCFFSLWYHVVASTIVESGFNVPVSLIVRIRIIIGMPLLIQHWGNLHITAKRSIKRVLKVN